MFVKALEKSREWTYPITFGVKDKKGKDVNVVNGTLIKINNDGYFLTSKIIANLLINHFNNPQESHVMIPFKLLNDTKINITNHKLLDLSIIEIENLSLEESNPNFLSDMPEPGTTICRTGFAHSVENPFVLKNKVVEVNPDIPYENTFLPMEGMVTRNINLLINNNTISNAVFEISTPNISNQLAGPILDKEGNILGIQSHNIDVTITKDEHIKLGTGISSQKIISFLSDNNIDFN